MNTCRNNHRLFLNLEHIQTSADSTDKTFAVRLWFKNWVCHVHFNFEIQLGMASSIFNQLPPNFGKRFYKSSNDIKTFFDTLNQKSVI